MEIVLHAVAPAESKRHGTLRVRIDNQNPKAPLCKIPRQTKRGRCLGDSTLLVGDDQLMRHEFCSVRLRLAQAVASSSPERSANRLQSRGNIPPVTFPVPEFCPL